MKDKKKWFINFVVNKYVYEKSVKFNIKYSEKNIIFIKTHKNY